MASDLQAAAAALELALARGKAASRGTRAAVQSLARARDALQDVTHLRLRAPADIERVRRVLTGALKDGEVDVIVLATHDHSPPPGAQTTETT